MAAIDVISALAPDVVGSVPNLNDRIALADRATSRTAFGNRRDEAVAYLTLHQIAVSAISTSSGGAGAGGVTSASVGSVSRGFGGAGGKEQDAGGVLATTIWGRELIRLREECISGMPARGMCIY